MPSGDNDTPERAEADFASEWQQAVIDARYNHPSIVMWVPFNEGWGQYDTARHASGQVDGAYDPTRLVNDASGWTDAGVGDVHDIHAYPGPACRPSSARAPRCSASSAAWACRCAATPGRTRRTGATSASRALPNSSRPTWTCRAAPAARRQGALRGDLHADHRRRDRGQRPDDLRPRGRQDPEATLRPFTGRSTALPLVRTVLPTSDGRAKLALRTDERPGGDGRRRVRRRRVADGRGRVRQRHARRPGPHRVDDPAIWLRRGFEWAGGHRRPAPRLHHDEDAEIFINGVLAARLSGYTTGYVLAPIAREALEALQGSKNVLAVHCQQTGGGHRRGDGAVNARARRWALGAGRWALGAS